MVNNKQPILIGLIIILALALVYSLATRPGKTDNRNTGNYGEETAEKSEQPAAAPAKPAPMTAQAPAPLTDEQKNELQAGAAAHQPTELTFNITAGNFYFTPNELRVKQGDKVKIVFNNVNGTHNLMLPAFNVATKTIKEGESDTVEFVAKDKGIFEFYCLVGNGYHRMMGQIGVLLVE